MQNVLCLSKLLSREQKRKREREEIVLEDMGIRDPQDPPTGLNPSISMSISLQKNPVSRCTNNDGRTRFCLSIGPR